MIDYRININQSANKHAKEKNQKLSLSLPDYDTLVDYTDELYNSNEWIDYIINYLILYYNVRNLDLVFEIVNLKRETVDTNKNYLWVTNKKVVFIRNIYKTAKVYNQKVNVITDIKFITAMKRVRDLQKLDFESGIIIKNINQLGYYIQKATYNNLGEGNYLKIVLNHYRNDFNMIKEISKNRGTSIDTLSEFYDLKSIE